MEKFRREYNQEAATFRGIHVSKKHASRIESDSATVHTVLQATINHLDKRFQSAISSDTLSAGFNLLVWPADLDEFGNEDITTLAQAFQSLLRAVHDVHEDQCQTQPLDEGSDFLALLGPPTRRRRSFNELVSCIQSGRN